ncbi:MAG: hypothetical protein U0414_02725 [Polyangiaceae bacterium]
MNPHSRRITRALSIPLALAWGVGCGSGGPEVAAPTALPGPSPSSSVVAAASTTPSAATNVPTPESISKAEPGGDAEDPELAALTRLAEEEDSFILDKPKVLAVHLIDAMYWRRVKASALPSRAMFRYGDETHALAVVMYQPSDGPDDPRSCLKKFMAFADDAATSYDISYEVSPVYEREQTVDGAKKPMLIQLAEGRVHAPFFQDDYVGGIAAYQSFPGTCLVQAIAIISTHHPVAARRARDRWVNDSAPLLQWDMKKIGDGPPPFADR